MTEENTPFDTIGQPQSLASASCYALPQEGIRHMHNEAAKIEAEALPLMSDGFLHDAYCKLEISRALRVAANYCDGTAVKLA